MHFIKLRKVYQPSKTIVAKHIIFRYTVHRRSEVHSQIATLGSICALLPPHRIFTGAWHQAKVWSRNRYICRTELWHLNCKSPEADGWPALLNIVLHFGCPSRDLSGGGKNGPIHRSDRAPSGLNGWSWWGRPVLMPGFTPPPPPTLGQMVNELSNGANSC